MRKFTILIVLSLILTITSANSQQNNIPKETLQKIEKYFAGKR